VNYQKVIDKLTPVEQHGDMLFKRDDMFIPFKDMPLNGGKVRQALSLVCSFSAGYHCGKDSKGVRFIIYTRYC